MENIFYEELDKSEITKAKPLLEQGDVDNIIHDVVSKEELKKILMSKPQEDTDEDRSYREILEWDMKAPISNSSILSEIVTDQRVEERSELLEMLKRSEEYKNRDTDREFDVSPPEDIVQDGDVIMYASKVSQSINTIQRPTVLKMSKKDQSTGTDDPCVGEYPGYSLDNLEPGNSKTVCTNISHIRAEMAEFSKQFDEFKAKYNQPKKALVSKIILIFLVNLIKFHSKDSFSGSFTLFLPLLYFHTFVSKTAISFILPTDQGLQRSGRKGNDRNRENDESARIIH